jgi:hypothetical protein
MMRPAPDALVDGRLLDDLVFVEQDLELCQRHVDRANLVET